jgi:enterochelin esterase-like enzyme
VSPDVLGDRRVTFRIYAPKASSVTLRGDWMEGSATVHLTKTDDGVWSATVGPLTPDFYSYTLTVDSVRTLDPKNPTIKQGIASVDNMFVVAGRESAFQENRPVPHGEIRQAWYRSTTLDMQRRLHVYTPSGYDGSSTRYPALYLLHGGGDDDSGWSSIGRAGFILDNLLADKKAVPMIIVMPNGSLPRPPGMPAAVPGTPPEPAVMAALQERFTNELMKDVIPFVERQYRVVPGAGTRAIAGLSMGGGQTLRVITTHRISSATRPSGTLISVRCWRPTSRLGPRALWAAPTRSTAASGCCPSAWATRTPRSKDRRTSRPRWTGTASSTSSTSAAAVTRGSTGGGT